MADEYVYQISSRYLQQWLRYNIDMSKTGTCHLISGPYRDFPNFIFWPVLTFQKVFRVIFRVLCENLT